MRYGQISLHACRTVLDSLKHLPLGEALVLLFSLREARDDCISAVQPQPRRGNLGERRVANIWNSGHTPETGLATTRPPKLEERALKVLRYLESHGSVHARAAAHGDPTCSGSTGMMSQRTESHELEASYTEACSPLAVHCFATSARSIISSARSPNHGSQEAEIAVRCRPYISSGGVEQAAKEPYKAIPIASLL